MIKIELECNTVSEMTEALKSLLSTLTGDPTTPAKATPAKATPAKATPAKATPAKATAKPEPEPEETTEPEPEETTEPEQEDDLGLPEPAQEHKLEDAVSLAQDFVAKGKSAEVRKALNAVAGDGARIGGLAGAQIGQFIAALKG